MIGFSSLAPFVVGLFNARLSPHNQLGVEGFRTKTRFSVLLLFFRSCFEKSLVRHNPRINVRTHHRQREPFRPFFSTVCTIFGTGFFSFDPRCEVSLMRIGKTRYMARFLFCEGCWLFPCDFNGKVEPVETKNRKQLCESSPWVRIEITAESCES